MLFQELEPPVILFVDRHAVFLWLGVGGEALQCFSLFLLQFFQILFLDPFLIPFLIVKTLFAVKCFLGDVISRRVQTIRVETSIAFVTNNEFHVVVLVVLVTQFACHILKSFIPLLSCNVHRTETQVTFAFLSTTKALCQGSVKHVKLIVEGQLCVFLHVSECKDADADFSKDIPLLGYAVRLARVIYETSKISLFSRVYNFAFAGLH